MLRKLLLTLCLCSALSTTLHAEDAVPPLTLVEVDGFPVTNLHLALFASQTGRTTQDPDAQIDLLNELVNSFMIANSAQGKALAEQAEVTAALDVARARLLAQSYVRAQLQQTTIDEKEIQTLYDEQYGGAGQLEFKARHILVADEADALAVIEALDKGTDFAELAGERSIGPSKTQGGDLGWFEADQMVPAFSAATAELADGSYSKTPIKTQFGWHVILREQSRQAPPPSLDSVRPQLEVQLQQRQVAKAINAIRENAKIEVKDLRKSE